MSAKNEEWGTQIENTLRAQIEGLGAFFVQGATALFVLLGLALLLVMFASRLLGRGRSRTGMALGAQAAFGMRLFGAWFALSLLVLFAYSAAPLLVTVLLGALVAGALVAVGFRSRAWLGGAWTILRGHLKTANRLTIAQGQGVVESFGLFHLVLRLDNGDRLHVPISALHDQPFSIATPDKTVAVELSVTVKNEHELARLRWAAHWCGYRDRRAEVQFVRDAHDPLTVHLRFRSWSAEAAERAANYIRRAQSLPLTPT